MPRAWPVIFGCGNTTTKSIWNWNAQPAKDFAKSAERAGLIVEKLQAAAS
jgi:hypothetical protein